MKTIKKILACFVLLIVPISWDIEMPEWILDYGEQASEEMIKLGGIKDNG